MRDIIIFLRQKCAPALKTELTLGYPGDSHTFCTLNPPVSPGVGRSSSLSERMARGDVPGMPAACGMSEHMASLSGDNGEAAGSCPEPAGRCAALCQPRCNSPFQGGPHFSIKTVLRAARLGHYHNGVTWEAGNRQGRGLSGRTN